MIFLLQSEDLVTFSGFILYFDLVGNLLLDIKDLSLDSLEGISKLCHFLDTCFAFNDLRLDLIDNLSLNLVTQEIVEVFTRSLTVPKAVSESSIEKIHECLVLALFDLINKRLGTLHKDFLSLVEEECARKITKDSLFRVHFVCLWVVIVEEEPEGFTVLLASNVEPKVNVGCGFAVGLQGNTSEKVPESNMWELFLEHLGQLLGGYDHEA